MAKLTNIHIVKLFDNDRIVFDTPVSVTKDGMFTTTLPKDVAEQLESYGPKLEVNRAGRAGFFSSDTLEGLRREVEKTVSEAISRELVEDKLVIKYRVTTRCSYVVDSDGEIIPNGYWQKEDADRERTTADWHEGNANDPFRGDLPTVSVYARVFHKRTYAYKSGRTIEKLEPYNPEIHKGRGKSIDWINSIVDIRSSSSEFHDDEKRISYMPEVEATEENAAIFVKLFKLIFQCNEMFKGLNNPEVMLAFIKNNSLLQIK